MTETAHTPLPWVANDQHSGANPWRIETDDGVWANNGWIIAECCGPDAEANAAFIVQAVNSHHRLVEALEDIVNPLGKLRRDAEAEGRQLSNMAHSIANDLSFVQSIARQALKDTTHD